MLRFPTELRSVAARQHGVLSRIQLADQGIGGVELARWKQRGWLTPYGTNVFRLVGSPVTDTLKLNAALLDAGPNAALSHRTAADLHWFESTLNRNRPIELCVPKGRHVIRPDLLIRETRELLDADCVVVNGLRTTSGTRTLIDLAAILDRRMLTTNVDAALAKRRSSARAIYQRLEAMRTRGREGLSLLAIVLEDRPDGGLASVLERAFFELLKPTGIPLPCTQVVFVDRSTHIARVDAEFSSGLIVELLSKAWHTSPAAVKADSIRRRNLRLLGREVVEFWAEEVFSTPDFVVAELRRHLAIGVRPVLA